jgi:hypothetical protein
MFDLEKAICNWRQQWAAAGIKSPEILRELENHLREDIQIQMGEGFDAQKAFENSVLRLGQASVIKGEFAKTATARRTLDRFRAALCVLLVAAIVWLSGYTFANLGMNPGEWLVASSAVVTCLFVAGFWTHGVRFLPVIYNQRKRYAIEIALFISGFICSNLLGAFVLPYFERNLNGKILPAIWLWLVFPIAIFIAAACGIEQAVRGRPSANRPATS